MPIIVYAKLLCCFIVFSPEIDKKILIIFQNVRKKLRITQNVIFLNEYEKRHITRKGFDLMEIIFFGQTYETGHI